jgi:hypothetical protein
MDVNLNAETFTMNLGKNKCTECQGHFLKCLTLVKNQELSRVSAHFTMFRV